MSKPKYLYIDDESGASEKSAINVFNDLGIIEVELFKLSDFREFGKLRNELVDRRRRQTFDRAVRQYA